MKDIAAPDCFIIEETLRKEMKIPVFHDDQHGTAIISAAALINAALVTKRDLKTIRIVFNGAGAAAISCARIYKSLGVKPENILMCDSHGVIYKGREKGMNKWKEEFAVATERRTLTQALEGADCFVGLSVANVLTEDMLKGMAEKPMIFAMANPDPEIDPDIARKVRPDCIIATGRSDFPNQVNNVLGFPFIFRGALDVRATQINEAMKLAAVNALAELAREDVPESVSTAYSNKIFQFGPDYIIPKPFDPRVLVKVAPAVAKAAMETGVAQKPITSFRAYRERLEALQSVRRGFIRTYINKVKSKAKKKDEDVPLIVFPEGRSTKVLKALNMLRNERVCRPILLGYEDQIRQKIQDLGLDEELNEIPVYQPSHIHRSNVMLTRFTKCENAGA